MKNFFNKLRIKNFSSFTNANFINKIKNIFEIIIENILPENWKESRKSYMLFWLIGTFSISFVIWASLAQINQVVRASGTVTPDSKIHVVQTALSGPLEDIKISLGDKIESGDILFIIDNLNAKELHDLAEAEVETRAKKVQIIEQLVSKGSDSEFRLLDEKLALIEAQKDLNKLKDV